jgi:hypothetical protein
MKFIRSGADFRLITKQSIKFLSVFLILNIYLLDSNNNVIFKIIPLNLNKIDGIIKKGYYMM